VEEDTRVTISVAVMETIAVVVPRVAAVVAGVSEPIVVVEFVLEAGVKVAVQDFS